MEFFAIAKIYKVNIKQMWNTKIINFLETELNGNIHLFAETPYYRGDPALRKANLVFDLTEDEKIILSEIKDPLKYVEYVRIREYGSHAWRNISLRGYQQEFLQKALANRFTAVLASRQMGLTTMDTILAMHFVNNNHDKNFVYVTHNSMSCVEFIDNVKQIYMNLPFFMKPGIVAWNAKSIEFDNGCKIYAKSNGLQSMTANFLVIDNAAFIIDPEKICNAFFSVASGDSRIVIKSSLNGYNWFYSKFKDAEDGKNDFVPLRYKWDLIPERNEAWKQNEIRNIGQEAFDREYDLKFTERKEAEKIMDEVSKDWIRDEIRSIYKRLKKLEDMLGSAN
jgi:hypothetical protein